MIDWVMPLIGWCHLKRPWPFIFIGWGGLAPQGILLNSKFARTPQFYPDSGSTVRPARPTGQTGVAVAESATRRSTGQTVEGHRSDRWHQLDRPCANFGCEQIFSKWLVLVRPGPSGRSEAREKLAMWPCSPASVLVTDCKEKVRSPSLSFTNNYEIMLFLEMNIFFKMIGTRSTWSIRPIRSPGKAGDVPFSPASVLVTDCKEKVQSLSLLHK
jgi:hypothetical protein